MKPSERSPLEPFSSVITVMFKVTLALILVGIGFTLVGSGSFLTFGQNASACVTFDPHHWSTAYDAGMGPLKNMGQPGTSMNVPTLELCDQTPGLARRALSALTEAPTMLLYLAVFYLFVRLIGRAERDSPFSPAVASHLLHIGWTLVLGGYLAHATQDAAKQTLVTVLTKPGTELHPHPAWILFEGLVTLPLATILAGLGMLTLAKIMRLGARMREDLAGTV